MKGSEIGLILSSLILSINVYHNVLRGIFTAGHIVVVLLAGLFLSIFDYELALGQGQSQQQSLLTYKNPNLGGSIQYPSDWELQEESNDKLRFIKQEGFVTADLNVENLDEPKTMLSEYASTRVNELQAQRPEFQLISNEPTTISNKPAQKVVYTFEREEDGKTNKVMRIWSINEGKLYTLAHVAESSQYNRYLPTFQRMVDSFSIGPSSSSPGSSTTQVQSSDGNREENNERLPPTPPINGDRNCNPSYPTVCIESPPPQLNCGNIPYKNFKVTNHPPHITYGKEFEIETDVPNEIQAVALMRPSVTTHCVDTEQRYVGVDFSHNNHDRLIAKIPSNRNIAPPGYYMLFVIKENNIPSKARFVLLS